MPSVGILWKQSSLIARNYSSYANILHWIDDPCQTVFLWFDKEFSIIIYQHCILFSMHNGVRQGWILSALAYRFYCEQLFAILERQLHGCWVQDYFLGLLCYSDDNICLAPSLNALQKMLRTCEEFALSHNLKFSTDPNPKKCKTKTLAFLKKPRDLPPMMLCGNPLPWTVTCKHLGVHIGNKINGCEEDMRRKNTEYVRKNIELNQEFWCAHPATKIQANRIYNSSYYCSPLWNLFGPGALSMESS